MWALALVELDTAEVEGMGQMWDVLLSSGCPGREEEGEEVKRGEEKRGPKGMAVSEYKEWAAASNVKTHQVKGGSSKGNLKKKNNMKKVYT